MRSLVMLLVVIVAVGCTGPDGEPPTPTTATPAMPEPTPTPGPSPEPTPEPPTPSPDPAASPPVIVADQTFDFNTEGDPTGQSVEDRPTDAVPADAATVVVNITLTRSSPAPATLPISGSIQQPKVRVIASNGTQMMLVDMEGATLSQTFPALPGAWTVRYEGSGTMRATVLMTAHP